MVGVIPVDVRGLRRLRPLLKSPPPSLLAEIFRHILAKALEVLADIFTHILVDGEEPPKSWRHTCIKVLFKKGDPHIPGNYRPISILPVLYKLFSMVLHARLEKYLEPQQSADQAGFRKGYCCDDHLLTVALIQEKCSEFNQDLWIAAVRFEKAFDSVSHEAIWRALQEQGVPPKCIDVLTRLYAKQTGQVVSDRTSRTFKLERGTKQGDPMSPALFNAVLESIMRPLQQAWQKKRYGLNMCCRRLTNLRFADDILLVGQTRAATKHMLEDLAVQAGRVGLKLHLGKTKILSNVQNRRGVLAQRHVQVGDGTVEVLPFTEGTAYLGHYLSFHNFHDAEIQNHIVKGWKAFGKYRDELCNKRYLIRSRLRLFDAVVTSAVLYGSGTWVMTAAREHKLETEMRRMFRLIIKTPRMSSSTEQDCEGETWVQWIVRSTHRALIEYKAAGFNNWVALQQERKRRLRERVEESVDARLAKLALLWIPGGVRSTGRPLKRWED